MGAPMPGTTCATPVWLKSLPLVYLLTGLAWILGSDLAVGLFYRDDLSALIYAGTLKGALFVILTAVLLYVLLAVRGTHFSAGKDALDPFELRKPIVAFALVGFGIASVGYVVYRLEENGIHGRARRQLELSAAAAAEGVAVAHERRVRAMQHLSGTPFTARDIKEWRTDRPALLVSLLRERLEVIRSSQGYSSVTALESDGRTLLAAGGALWVTPELRRAIADATASTGVIASWTILDGPGGERRPVADLVVALRERPDKDAPVVAVVVARAEVRWPDGTAPAAPGSSPSALTLARADGDRVLFMIPDQGSQAVRFQAMPRHDTALYAARGLLGGGAAYLARDRTGRAVMAASHPVRSTPWFVVASSSMQAIGQQLRRLALLIASMTGLGFVATAAMVLPWWRSVRAGTRTLVKDAESRAEEVATRLGWVTRHANDAILLIGQDGGILDANEKAEQLYGYTREELLSLDVFRLRVDSPVELATARRQFETVKQGGSLLFEATHVRKDGGTLPVEVSSRHVVLGDLGYVQSIVRDISDRRLAESRLRESEAQYRLMFRANPHPMWVYDVETLRFLAVNDAAVEHYGYSESEFLCRTIADIRPAADRERLTDHVQLHADDILQLSGAWQHLRKDGSIIDVEITSHRIDFAGRRARLVMSSDVTDRLRAERQVRTSEERYRSLFENASDGVLVIGVDRRILAANAEYQSMLGYPLDELLGIDMVLLLDASEYARLDAAAEDSRHGRLPGPTTWLHRRKDGSGFVGEVRMRLLPGGDLLVTVRDLTEIIAAHRRLERQRDLYDLLSQCNQCIAKVDNRQALLGSIARLAVERGGFQFAWIGEIDASGEIVPTAQYGDDRGYVATLRFSLDPTGPGGTGPTSLAMREGRPVIANDFLNDPKTVCWHERARRAGVAASGAFPIFQGGKVTAALMLYAGEAGFFDAEICATLEEMIADVSYALDALRAHREVEDGRLLLQSLINASDSPVFAFDLEGRAILMNDACARAMNDTPANLVGQRRDRVLAAETARAHEINDRCVAESGEHLVIEERNVEAGVERIYLSVKYPLRDADGHIYAVGGIATDITEMRRMQQELADSNQLLEQKVIERTRQALDACAKAEAADQAKTRFLSSVSHELRSPLNSIIGFTSVLLEGMDGELTPSQQEHLQIVSDASSHLLAIINDLLDMSKIESGAITPEPRPFVVNRLLARVVQRFKVLAEKNQLVLHLDGPHHEVRIDGDERRIEQILSNLVSNAIKYTPSGSVTVSFDCTDGRLRIAVSDTGPGIAAEDRSRLFKRFSQLRPARGALVEGTGLGLAISAGLAEAMGGEITLQSEPGAGSTFSLLLPVEIAEGHR